MEQKFGSDGALRCEQRHCRRHEQGSQGDEARNRQAAVQQQGQARQAYLARAQAHPRGGRVCSLREEDHRASEGWKGQARSQGGQEETGHALACQAKERGDDDRVAEDACHRWW